MSDINEPTFKIPIRSLKLNRVDLKKIRNSPQLRNIIRQKWQQRLKEKRSTSFNRRRFQPDEAEKLTDESTPSGMDQFIDIWNTEDDIDVNTDSDVDWENWFQKNYAEEEEQSTMSEYNDFLMFEQFVDSFFPHEDSSTIEVICPMCQKNLLTEQCGEIGCSDCKFVIPAKMSLGDFSNSINSKSTMHSANCNNCPTFITTPENDTISLFLTCDICSCCLLIM